jgi:PEP-CTERM motif
MLRRVLVVGCFIALVGLFSAGYAKADTIFTWTLPSSPTPTSSFSDLFTVNSVPYWMNGTSEGLAEIDFFTLSDFGGFELTTNNGDPITGILILNEFGPQVFTGSTGAPTFTPGTYTLTGEGTLSMGLSGTLTITAGPNGDSFTYDLVNTPEPGSLMLIGGGLLPFLGLARKRIFS